MRFQTLEKITHGERFFHFICETAERRHLLPIEAPQNKFKSPVEVFKVSLKHEKFVTTSVNNLMVMATDGRNHSVQLFLHWFIAERIEEKDSFSLILKKLHRIKGYGRGLLMIDQEPDQRVFVPPGTASGGAYQPFEVKGLSKAQNRPLFC